MWSFGRFSFYGSENIKKTHSWRNIQYLYIIDSNNWLISLCVENAYKKIYTIKIQVHEWTKNMDSSQKSKFIISKSTWKDYNVNYQAFEINIM